VLRVPAWPVKVHVEPQHATVKKVFPEHRKSMLRKDAAVRGGHPQGGPAR